MRNLIKLLFMLFAIALATESFAQKIGIMAGLNLSNMLMEDDEGTYSDDFKMLPGFHAGIIAEFGSKALVFQPGLLISTKGFKVSGTEEGFEYEGKMNLLYLDIPLAAKAYYDLGSAKLFVLFGPYIGVGLSGKTKYESTIMGLTVTDEEDVNFGSDEENDDFKRLDFGITGGAGVEISSFQLSINYAMGLANISAYTDGGATTKNRVVGISLAYFIKK